MAMRSRSTSKSSIPHAGSMLGWVSRKSRTGAPTTCWWRVLVEDGLVPGAGLVARDRHDEDLERFIAALQAVGRLGQDRLERPSELEPERLRLRAPGGQLVGALECQLDLTVADGDRIGSSHRIGKVAQRHLLHPSPLLA